VWFDPETGQESNKKSLFYKESTKKKERNVHGFEVHDSEMDFSRKLIMRLAESNTVRLIWSPGHHDTHGELSSATDLIANMLFGKVYYLRRDPPEAHSILEKLT
jgi:hypothetical protein